MPALEYLMCECESDFSLGLRDRETPWIRIIKSPAPGRLCSLLHMGFPDYVS